MQEDTIFALASAPGRAGVAVVRISGPQAQAAVGALIAPEDLPAPRHAGVRALYDPADGELLDRGLVLLFAGPRSFTGEDVVELQVHGGAAVAGALLPALARQPGLRPAEPGEFSRRAVLNGQLDLTQAEAVADLVAAETAAQRRQALRQLDGELGALYEDWRQRLLSLLAQAEAEIDFPDEDVPDDLIAGARPELERLSAEISRHLADGGRGERLRHGFYVVIVGPPNVGKSSLLNALARRDAAIVSATAGTTRDVIEVHLELDGYPVILADTAGLRQADDEIESEGVRRAKARAALADVTLVVGDATAPHDVLTALDEVGATALPVLNKGDLAPDAVAPTGGLLVSAKTGAGIDALMAALAKRAGEGLAPGAAPALTRERHRLALETTVEALQRGLTAEADELLVEDIRLSARALGRITGRVDVEDVLDLIFADFCIGK